MATILERIKQDCSLAPYTTIQLGGRAKHFVEVASYDDIRGALAFARERNLPTYVLGGGSNTVFPDKGFSGLVMRVALRGVDFSQEQTDGSVLAHAYAGEDWDAFVATTVTKNLAGVECLSGIPGLVGATPMQNVGAYGQEVSEVIREVEALDRETLEAVTFSAEECHFQYRGSRFKYADKGRHVITRVTYALRPDGGPVIRYPELQKAVRAYGQEISLPMVRDEVLRIRRSKSMVLDPRDPNTRSCGSFFLNPIISQEEYERIQDECRGAEEVPRFFVGEGVKIPAAWLISRAGFSKGYRRGGVGISENHMLALVNVGGTAQELLALAEEVQEKVQQRFGIRLVPEPEIVR